MRVQPIVEGEGEEQALPELLRRLQNLSGAFGLTFNRPYRRRRAEFIKEEPFRKMIRLALYQGCEGILILFDSDKDDCPLRVAPRLQAWADEESRGTPCEVVMANSEYEAWFLGALESLRGRRGIRADAVSHPDPESIRGAKERLNAWTETGSYAPSQDQPALTALFDLAAAHRSCRSFRRMVRAFGLLASAAGVEIKDWPPPTWL